MAKEALYWKSLANNIVQCQLCPRFCTIKDGERGNCGVRENQKGKLFSVVYGKPASVAVDPIEKKPLYHFLPGEQTLSFGTAGCNLHCLYCQNWKISQCSPEAIPSYDLLPKDIIKETESHKSRIISYTYTEPTIFYEYMYDTAILAKKQDIRNVMVSNGFICQQPLLEVARYIDAANIDFKGNDGFYKKITGAWLDPVLETLATLKRKKVWIELTNLIIPTLNDSDKDIKFMVNWIAENLGPDVPIHFSAFWPMHKLSNLPSTSLKTLRKAGKIASKKLNYVYIGNIRDDKGSNTYCPSCKKLLIGRVGFFIIGENNIINGKCKFCNEKIAGVWQ